MAKVLITGASRGIGYDTAMLLARQGHEVVATMRNPGASDLEKVAREEKLPVTVLAMDVDDDASVAGVFAEVGPSIEVLVNNAGIYSIDAVEDEGLDRFRQVMETELLRRRALREARPAGNARAQLGLHRQRQLDCRAHRVQRDQRL
jgi:NAD(P)-dependent dehydrogenase (short-subunit alcohol dehydrogenase family)